MSDCSFLPPQESIEKLEKERGKKKDIIEDKTVSKWALANGMINGQTSTNYKGANEPRNRRIDNLQDKRRLRTERPTESQSHRPTDKPTTWTNLPTNE